MAEIVTGGGRRRNRPGPPWGDGITPKHVARTAVYVAAGVLTLILISTLLGSVKKTPRDQIGISYGGGPVEGQHFQRIVNPGSNGDSAEGPFAEYPDEQIATVIELVKDIVKRHQIRPQHIVGHSDIAPQRKVDPGPKFPWKRLADAGLIPWPDAAAVAARRAGFEQSLPDVAWFQQRLARHGFAVPAHGELDAATRNVLRAFQMKYRPARHDGEPDAETAALLEVLTTP